jgi:hypothetical protein
MPIRPEFMVRGLDGRPQPPVELIERLKKFDARIGLFYTNASWAITEAWKETDPRRERIQQGDMQPEMAFDICGYLPITCSLDEALPYIERELRLHTADSFAALRYTAQHWNDIVQPAMVEDAVLGAVSDTMGQSVSGAGITPVTTDLTPSAPPDRMAVARAAKAEKAKLRYDANGVATA